MTILRNKYFKIETGFAILLLFCAHVFAEWTSQNSGVPNHLKSVKFVDISTGIAVGSAGIILKTIDGGDSWSAMNSGDRNNLNEVYFINRTTGWICGENGIILKTNDGGENWTPQNSGTSLNLESIYFYDANRGWAVGEAQRIVATENGGATWVIENYSPYDASVIFRAVHFSDVNNGWIVGDAAHIVRETSGSLGWVSSKISSISDLTRFNKVYFKDPNSGWIVGRKASLVFSKLEILKTGNGGTSWQITYPDSDGEMGLEALNDILFITKDLGWSVGQDGKIIHSKDGGDSWRLQTSGVSNILNSISFVDELNGWTVGDGGLILHTKNGGASGAGVSDRDNHKTPNFSLKQNYPNPFNSKTVIEFELTKTTTLSLTVFNVAGRHVKVLAKGSYAPGLHRFSFDADGLVSGMYFYKLSTDQFVQVNQMLFLQ